MTEAAVAVAVEGCLKGKKSGSGRGFDEGSEGGLACSALLCLELGQAEVEVTFQSVKGPQGRWLPL
jgi:hypothetical protein